VKSTWAVPSGPVTIAFANGMLRNPPAPAQVVARLTEQSNAGSVSLEGSVNVGVPVNLQATVGSAAFGGTTGAVVTYDSASDWANTNLTVTFPRWTVLEGFPSTGQRPCPPSVRVTGTPASATATMCWWTQEGAGATLSLVIRSPGVGLRGPVRIALADGLLRIPGAGSAATVRIAEQSGAGWVGLSTRVWLGVN